MQYQESVDAKILAFDVKNPLGVSTILNWILYIYIPLLVGTVWTLNIFAIWVLKSSFLRYLVVQPLIVILLNFHNFLMLIGPLYVWLMQTQCFYLTRNQVYPCFTLLWAHNSAIIATSWILVAILIERSLIIGKPEILWDLWQKACKNMVYLVVICAIVLAVGGLMCIDLTMLTGPQMYPMCHPWWDNEHGSVGPIWYKTISFVFSLGPCLITMMSLMVLMMIVARFRSVIGSGLEALNHYRALYTEMKATIHLKFVKSLMWLGPLFMLTVSPLGIFIVFGPAMYTRLYLQGNQTILESVKKSANVTVLFSNMSKVLVGKKLPEPPYPPMPIMHQSYVLVSRTDVETVVWLIYYSFSVLIVPVFLGTEVLFRREWRGRQKKISDFIMCVRNTSPRWPSFDILAEEDNAGCLSGPYIACSDENVAPKKGLKSSQTCKLIKIYDAGKADRSGRYVDKTLLDPLRKVHTCPPPVDKKIDSSVDQSKTKEKPTSPTQSPEPASEDRPMVVPPVQFMANSAMLKRLLHSPTQLEKSQDETGDQASSKEDMAQLSVKPTCVKMSGDSSSF